VINIYSNTAALKKAVVFYFLGIKKLSSSFTAGGGLFARISAPEDPRGSVKKMFQPHLLRFGFPSSDFHHSLLSAVPPGRW
jgi:hypothetical protein